MANSKNITFDQLQNALTRVKSALDGKANTSHGNHVPKTETANNARFLRNDNTWQTITPVNIGAADRSHSHGSYVNQNAFTNIKVGNTTVAADSPTDTLTLTAGANVTLTPDATNDTVTIAAKDTVYTHPTTSGYKHIPSGGSSGQILRWSADGTAAWGSDNNTDTKVTNTLNTTAKAYVTGTTSATTNTGTQVFDTGVYLDTTAGKLVATTFAGALSGNASSATKLQTARKFTIGNTERTFNGSGDVKWTLADIGAAAASHNHTSLTGVTKLQFAAGSSDSAVMKVTTEEANTYLDFEMNDDINTDMYRWRFSAYESTGATPYFNLMTLTAKDGSSARLTVNGDVTASSFTGNASSATKLQTARAIKIGNTSRNFDGTANVTWTLADIGAAAASHGTHVTYATATPLVAGTAAVGTSAKVAREDHVHPAQTAITGNAGTATKLQTARKLTIGNTGKNFDGSANVAWSLAEIGAAASSHSHSYVPLSNNSSTIIKADADASSTEEYAQLQAGHNYLRVTSSAGGTTTTTQGADKLTFNGNIVYHAGRKPTPAEIGAASSGHSHTNINFLDKRSENTTPANVSNGVSLHLKSAGTAGLNDGGSYYASLFLKPWNDISGGPYANIAVTGNQNMWVRTATANDSWNSWKQIAFTSSSITGNAATATKLQNARNIKIGNTSRSFNGTADVTWTLGDIGAAASNHGHSNMLTFKANHTSDWTSATSMADKVYMGGWHGTITDSSKNKGYVSLGLATSGKALDFMLDGDFYANENNLVLNTGNYKSHVTPANIGAATSNHNHGLLHNNLTVTVANTTTDSGWSMINDSYNGFILKSIRSNGSAPNWLQGNYSAGIAFGGADTKGVMSVSYNAPSIRFAGGNGTKPVWNMTLTGTSGKTYNMDSLAANTANTLATARTINGTSFNGSANITTANWGTARTLTIGKTGKSVNGSGNVTWTLDEIGAKTRIKKVIDLSNTKTYSVDKWYPCLAGIPYDGMHDIEVAVQLNSGIKPSWATHNSGFTCNLHIKALAGGWGTTSSDSIVLNYSYSFASANPCSYSQLNNSSNAVLWLRGGGKYFVFTDWDASWSVKTASTTISEQTVAPVTSCPSISLAKSTIIANLNGNAGTATKLQTTRSINGTNFDGSGNITTANWGTGRTLTIGNTGKSVNGSGNVSWTLNEIGAPSKTGSGASGTWGISITGKSNVTNYLDSNTRMDYGWNGVNYFNISGTAGHAAKVNDTPTTAWWHIMRFNHNNSAGFYTDLAIPFNSTSLYYKRITSGAVQNGGWVKVLDSLNYNEYAAAKSHGNHVPATQAADNKKFLRNDNTWQVVTPANIGAAAASHSHNYAGSSSAGGNANAAVKLATARSINGTNFDGSGNITTANWGTARTITIGNKGKTVNGSGNVSWSLSEIGALPTAGGTVSGNLAVSGTFSIGSKKITINSSAPSNPAVGDIWIKI